MSNSIADQAATQEAKPVHNAVKCERKRQATMTQLCNRVKQNASKSLKLLPVTQYNFEQSLISCLLV